MPLGALCAFGGGYARSLPVRRRAVASGGGRSSSRGGSKDPSRALIGSQVVLSFGISFSLWFPWCALLATLIGQWVNRRGVTGVAVLVVAVIAVHTVVLIYLTVV